MIPITLTTGESGPEIGSLTQGSQTVPKHHHLATGPPSEQPQTPI